MPGERAHQSGLVETGTDDHHGNNRHHGVRREAVEQVVDVDQWREKIADHADDHHDDDRGHVDANHFRDKQEDSEAENPEDHHHVLGEDEILDQGGVPGR